MQNPPPPMTINKIILEVDGHEVDLASIAFHIYLLNECVNLVQPSVFQ